MTNTQDEPRRQWGEETAKIYRRLASIAVPARAEQIACLLTLIPFDRNNSFRVVELASGEGYLAQAILKAFPQASILALDGEESMRTATAARLSQFGDRGTVDHFDIFADDWYDKIQDVDVVVSSLCIHHLDDQEKQTLYAQIFKRLSNRGALLIADLMQARRGEARGLFAAMWDEIAKLQSAADPEIFNFFVAREWNYFRYPDDYDKPSSLFEQLSWLHNAGFTGVDCFWMQAGHAIFGGYKGSDNVTNPLSYEAALEIARHVLSS